RWNAAERVQAYTHPLWMFVLAAATAATGEDYRTTMVLGLLLTAAAAARLARAASAPRRGVVVGLAAIALSSAVTDYATAGLENALVHLWVVLFGLECTAVAPRATRLALYAGAAACTRLDAV